jgi:1-acyl-sn-glycerol-3-phosphate acyltransferase
VEEPRLGRASPVDEALVEGILQLIQGLEDYFRLEVEGLDRIPDGRAVVASNHTGTLALDGLLLFKTLYEQVDRTAHVAVHPSFFRPPVLGEIAADVGLFEAGTAEATRVLDHDELLLFFPEGEDGNFKPLWEYYQLQGFHPGFARAALASGAPIVPVLVVGGEDANPALGQVDWIRRRFGVPVPVPPPAPPLPAKWRIEFLDPIPVERWTEQEDAVRRELDEEIAADVQARMQAELDRLVDERGNPFF